MPTLQLFPECHADTALVRFFIPNDQLVVHISGIQNVAKEMKETLDREDASIRIGFVDNDKRVPPYLLMFKTIIHENKVFLKRNGLTNQYLVVIDKAIESFLLWNTQQVDLDIAIYGFANDIKLLGKALKTSAIESNLNYRQLLTDLYARQAPGFLTLERILNDIITA